MPELHNLNTYFNFFINDQNDICYDITYNKIFPKYLLKLDEICDQINSMKNISTLGENKYDSLCLVDINWIIRQFDFGDSDRLKSWLETIIYARNFLSYIVINNDKSYIKGFQIDSSYNLLHPSLEYISSMIYVLFPEKDRRRDDYLGYCTYYLCTECFVYYHDCNSSYHHDFDKHARLVFKFLHDLQQINASNGNYLCLQDQINAVTTKLDKFISKHKNDCEHLRMDVDTCADIIYKNMKNQKVYCDETNLYINDLQDRISRLESLLCDNVDSQIIDRILNINKESESLEQVVKKQQQTIDELQEELKKQREEFEEYKSQKQKQLAAIMSQM